LWLNRLLFKEVQPGITVDKIVRAGATQNHPEGTTGASTRGGPVCKGLERTAVAEGVAVDGDGEVGARAGAARLRADHATAADEASGVGQRDHDVNGVEHRRRLIRVNHGAVSGNAAAHAGPPRRVAARAVPDR